MVTHKHEGKTEIPKVVLYDEFGVPLPNSDQRNVDVHGRELQPASDEHMPYAPTELTEAGQAERSQMQQDRLTQKPFTQKDIDVVRHRVRLNFARTCILERRQHIQMHYLWWPTPGDIGTYHLRMGNPPADGDRPKHLKRLRLEIDCTHMPSSIYSLLCPGGRLEQLVQERIDVSDDPSLPSAVVLQGAIRTLADEMSARGLPL